MARQDPSRVSPGPAVLAVAPLVTLLTGIFGVGLVQWLSSRLGTRVSWDGDVINRSIVEGHQKGEEVVVFVVACIIIPALCASAVLLARRVGHGVRPRLFATLAHAGLIVWVPLTSSGVLLLGPALALGAVVYAIGMVVALASGPEAGPPPSPLPGPRGGTRQDVGMAVGTLLVAGCALVPPWMRVGPDDFERARMATALAALAGVAAVALAWGILMAFSRRRRAPGTLGPWQGFLPLSALTLGNVLPIPRPILYAAALGATLVCVVGALRGWLGPTWPGSPLLRAVFWWCWVPIVLYCTSFAHDTAGPIDLYHEGERITVAAAVAKGAAPYRDVFVWHGLAENALVPQLGLRREWSVHGARLVKHAVDPLATVGLYALLCASLGSGARGLAATLAALFLLPAPTGRYWLAFLAYAALTWWLVRGARGRLFAFAAGGLVVSSLFYSLDGGTAAAVAATLTLLYGITVRDRGPEPRWWQGVAAFTAGAAAAAILPLAYLAHHRAIGAFFTSSLDIVGGLSDRSSRPFPPIPWTNLRSPVDLFHSKAWAMYLPAVITVWGFAHVATHRALGLANGSSLGLPVAALGAAAFFRAVIRRSDMDHVTKILPLAFTVWLGLLCAYGERIRLPGWPSRISHGLVLALLAMLGVSLLGFDPETVPARNLLCRRGPAPGVREIRLGRAGSGVSAEPRTAAWIERVVTYLRGALGPGEAFYDFTNGGLFYFLADRPCPTRYVQTTYAASREAQREVIASLQRVLPRLVLFPSGDEEKYGYDWLIHPLRHPLITRYLYQTYVPVDLVDDTIILARRQDALPQGPRVVEHFIASTTFGGDLGHLPLLLGRLDEPVDVVTEWPASQVATWEGAQALRLESPGVASGWVKRLVSPRLHIDPDPTHAVLLRLAAVGGGQARLLFSSARRDVLDGSASLRFFVSGDGMVHTYRIDVGLLPAWVWRGHVTGMQFEFPEGLRHAHIESVALARVVTAPPS